LQTIIRIREEEEKKKKKKRRKREKDDHDMSGEYGVENREGSEQNHCFFKVLFRVNKIIFSFIFPFIFLWYFLDYHTMKMNREDASKHVNEHGESWT